MILVEIEPNKHIHIESWKLSKLEQIFVIFYAKAALYPDYVLMDRRLFLDDPINNWLKDAPDVELEKIDFEIQGVQIKIGRDVVGFNPDLHPNMYFHSDIATMLEDERKFNERRLRMLEVSPAMTPVTNSEVTTMGLSQGAMSAGQAMGACSMFQEELSK